MVIEENTHARNIAFCLVGEGGSGKTNFLDVVSSVFSNKCKLITKLDGKTDRQIKSLNLDGSHKYAADLYTCERFITPTSLIKRIVMDMGGCLLMTVRERPETDPLDHGLNWRVCFIDFENRFVRGRCKTRQYIRQRKSLPQPSS